ncbi:MAG: alpha/beta hydrolase family protein, partial [Gammaproteobacteria bacterium]|nr:alpha/beta hydrolase family protein [Gammaproteobacteria bacterium]
KPGDRAIYLNRKSFSAPAASQGSPTFSILLFFIIFISSTQLHAGNLWTEKLLGEALVTTSNDKEVVWLDENGWQIFSLYKESPRSDLQGGVILLHDVGTHPDWPQIIAPLRQRLTQSGWNTLSLMMPSFDDNQDDNESLQWLYVDSEKRITSAINHFQNKNVLNIVIVAHGHSASVAAHYLSQQPADSVRALVGIGFTTRPEQPGAWQDVASSLSKLQIPVLDIYGELDNPDVLRGANSRLEAAQRSGRANPTQTSPQRTVKVRQLAWKKTQNLGYRQLNITGADHYFSKQQDRLINQIDGWLRVYAQGQEIQTK